MPDSSRPKRSRKATNRVPTADKAVAEALAIVREARDGDAELDWTRDPANDRERELRAACIRRVVAETRVLRESFYQYLNHEEPSEEKLASRELSIAIGIYFALKELLPDDAYFSDEIGDDLREAIEYWDRVSDEHRKRENQLRRRRLVGQARLDIGPASGLS